MVAGHVAGHLVAVEARAAVAALAAHALAVAAVAAVPAAIDVCGTLVCAICMR